MKHLTEWAGAASVILSYGAVFGASFFIMKGGSGEVVDFANQFREIVAPSAAAVVGAAIAFIQRNIFDNPDREPRSFSQPGSIVFIGAPIVFAVIGLLLLALASQAGAPLEYLGCVVGFTSAFSGFYVYIALAAFNEQVPSGPAALNEAAGSGSD